jgi:uncharacterized membrane protein YbaN (DUF454 family)
VGIGEGGEPIVAGTKRAAALRFAYVIAGFVLLGLGIIGAFLPLMPTTIFVILAAGCFARSSERIETWLLEHKRFGPTIKAWRAEGAIPRRGKVLAAIGMVVGYVLFLIGAQPNWMLALFVLAIFGGCAWFVLSRPEPTGN